MITQVRLEDVSMLQAAGDGPVVWKTIAPDGGSQSRRVEFGSPPEGFRSEGVLSLPELTRDYGSERLRVSVETNQVASILTAFTISELPTNGDVAFSGDEVVARSSLSKMQASQCDKPLTSRVFTVLIRVVVGASIVLALGLSLLRWVRSRRHIN